MTLPQTQIITTCNRKGGMCKSTSSLNIACTLAERGYKVLLVDLDDQQNTTKSISGIVKNNDKTIEDLLLKDDVVLLDVICETAWEGVWILPASNSLSSVVKELDTAIGGYLVLKEKLTTSGNFDFIIMDTSPSLNVLVVSALCASKYIFIPMASHFYGMQGLNQTIEAFKKVKEKLNNELNILGIAFVNHDKRSALACEVVESVKKKYGSFVFENIVGVNVRIEEAQVNKQSIITYLPNDRGSEQYRKLVTELVNRIGR